MVIPEVWTAHVPVEIFGLHIEREHISQNGIHRSAYVFDSLARQIGSRREWRVASLHQLQAFLRVRFVHGIVTSVGLLILMFAPRPLLFVLVARLFS